MRKKRNEGMRRRRKRSLLCATLHHLREQGDAVQIDELLGEGDVTRGAGQVLQGLQLGVHAGRLDAFVQLQRRRGLASRGSRVVEETEEETWSPRGLVQM